MKKIKMLAAAISGVCLMATSGFALSLTDPGVVGSIEAGTQSGDVENVTEWANHLLDLGASQTETADGNIPLDGDTENYATSSTDYNGDLSGGTRIDGATPTGLDAFEWVVGKYDGQNAGYVLFNMSDFGGDTIPEFSFDIWGTHAGQYQLSNITGYGGTTTVPEPASTLLLGLGLAGVAFFGRKKLLGRA